MPFPYADSYRPNDHCIRFANGYHSALHLVKEKMNFRSKHTYTSVS